MDTTETKQLIARHFDYSPHGTGQFFHGEWFTPKHKDSLAYLLEELDSDEQHELQETIKEFEANAKDDSQTIDNLRDEIKQLESTEEQLETSIRVLEDEVADLKSVIRDLERETGAV